jgi:hypothetical protein
VKGLSFGGAKPFEATMTARSAVVLESPIADFESPDTVIASQSVSGALVEVAR